MNILFPSSPLNPKEVNPAFSIEAEVCNILDITYSLFDYEAFLTGDCSSLDAISEGETIYRGFAMHPFSYSIFYQKLMLRDVYLINVPSDYKLMQRYEYLYPEIRNSAVYSLFQETLDHKAFLENFRANNIWTGSICVNDFINSKKCFIIYDMDDEEEFYNVCSDMRKNKGYDFYEGHCFSPVIKPCMYNKIESKYEHRAFFFKNRLISYRGNDSYTLRKDEELINKIKDLNLPSDFFSVDFVMDPKKPQEDKIHMLISGIGDGQVSCLKNNKETLSFYENIKKIVCNLSLWNGKI
jgi:hypothetical protein